ncbi:hypothetical protein HW537_14535 [Asaia siamensis]
MTHEQKPESAEFRTLGTITMTTAEYDWVVKDAEARGAAEQRRRDEEKRELIAVNLDRPGLIEWSVHILGPDDVHPCGSRSEAEALAEETNILAGSTNKGRSDDEFVTYAAYVVPRFKADREAEQSRKDAAISPAVTEELATALNELGQARAVIVELQGAPRSRQDAEAFESLERYGGAVRAALRAWQHIREGGAT